GKRRVGVGGVGRVEAAGTIDAHDHIGSPGFIDLLGQDQNAVLNEPQLEAKVRQGVTSELTGEGFSPGPIKPDPSVKWRTLGEYLDLIDHKGSAINIGVLAGASNPREIVIGDVN